MRIFHDVEIAKSTLLRRSPLDTEEVDPASKERIRAIFGEDLSPVNAVNRIITEVRAKGDDALRAYTEKIDGVKIDVFQATTQEIVAARDELDGELLSALELAAERIESFHRKALRQSWIDLSEGTLGQIIQPVDSVGAYVPGGSAAYPSTVLMTALPARVAGVRQLIITTPPRSDGTISPATLAAADIAGVDAVFKVGGAQAIAALAFGTETIPNVDKICGPGNIFVQLAKKLVYGTVGIDGLYGPTETVLIADMSADPVLCAADLLSQAEHDPLASALLITDSPELAEKVNEEVSRQLEVLDRKEIAAASLESKGGIVVVESLEVAIALANDYAPEHLNLFIQEAWSYLGRIRNAGGVFVGEASPENLGDYVAGPSHVMPTGGTARFSSPLGVEDFLKTTSVVALEGRRAAELHLAAETLAQCEGLGGHARSARERSNRSTGEER
jgi:histidinol dehydrogenase